MLRDRHAAGWLRGRPHRIQGRAFSDWRLGEAGGLGLFVGVVARANQWPGLYVAEAHLQGFVLQEGKFVRCVEARHCQMVARGP